MASRQTNQLVSFLAALKYDDIPGPVINRTEELFLDWAGSALASEGSRPIPVFERYAQRMGPPDGPSTILVGKRTSSPYFAAFINAASSHLVEQDDLHNSSVLHPATVVFPAALAAAQELRKTGRDLLLASVAGYEAGIRIGEFMGRTHYEVFHTTGTVGTLAAAVAVGKLHGFDEERFSHLLGSAGTQASGLWQFMRDGADSKQLHTAKAASDGLLAAYMTQDGLTGARDIFQGQQGMAAGMSRSSHPDKLCDRLGNRWAIIETSFKYHACCRHTHPAADALLELMRREKLKHDHIVTVTAGVHQAAIDVLGPVVDPQSVHQVKFSMGTTLGLIAVHGNAGLNEFRDLALADPAVLAFSEMVRMVRDEEVDAAYPQRWLGRVEVTTTDGRTLRCAIDEPKGDPGNTLSRAELEDKFRRLVAFSGARNGVEVEDFIAKVWRMREVDDLQIYA